MSHRQQMNQIN